MRIKKTSQTTPVQAEVINTYSQSTEDAYSANYVNNILANIPILNLKVGQNISVSSNAFTPLKFATIIDNTASEYLELNSATNGVTVKKDCTVMCSGSIYLNSTGSGGTQFLIAKNDYSDVDNTNYVKGKTIQKLNTSYDGFSSSTVSFSVSSGDTIYFVVQNGSGFTTNSNCFVHITVIGK